MEGRTKGLDLLLLFALRCGSKDFAENIKKYFEGKYDAEKITREIPFELKTAWPQLCLIAEKMRNHPLSLKVVSFYIFKKHNQLKLVTPSCKTKSGIISLIDEKKNILSVLTLFGKEEKVGFHDFQKNDLKKGDRIAFHKNHLVTKISLKQYRGLNN